MSKKINNENSEIGQVMPIETRQWNNDKSDI